ncbi:MAG: hypothetical protein QOE71_1473, partial [Pseudonocardiales bacterium]|nr:hypothetical protein [Pseudonocardiales bacterium]
DAADRPGNGGTRRVTRRNCETGPAAARGSQVVSQRSHQVGLNLQIPQRINTPRGHRGRRCGSRVRRQRDLRARHWRRWAAPVHNRQTDRDNNGSEIGDSPPPPRGGTVPTRRLGDLGGARQRQRVVRLAVGLVRETPFAAHRSSVPRRLTDGNNSRSHRGVASQPDSATATSPVVIVRLTSLRRDRLAPHCEHPELPRSGTVGIALI